jgi:hypothetical protein
MRRKISTALLLALLLAAVPAAVSARTSKPVIKGEEAGYFGGATVTHQFSVFVYSNLGPNAGNQVRVCVQGTCKSARGHSARLAWYSASFTTRGLRMGDPVKFSVDASTSAGSAHVTVTKPLLCMHNNGSTPQR